jgi:hypothetical protein
MHYEKYYRFTGISSSRSRHMHLALAIRSEEQVGGGGAFYRLLCIHF